MCALEGCLLEKEVPIHHRNNFRQYLKHGLSGSRLKEFRSAFKFYTKYPETAEIGKEWKEKYAKKANLTAIILTLKRIEEKTNVHLHRICKTNYPLCVWISHHYDELKPYLESFYFFDIPKNIEGVQPYLSEDPVSEAKKELETKDYTKENIRQVLLRLAKTLLDSGKQINSITTVRSDDNEVFITVVPKIGKSHTIKEQQIITQIKQEDEIHFPKLYIPPLDQPFSMVPITEVSENPLLPSISKNQFVFYNTEISISPEENIPNMRNQFYNFRTSNNIKGFVKCLHICKETHNDFNINSLLN